MTAPADSVHRMDFRPPLTLEALDTSSDVAATALVAEVRRGHARRSLGWAAGRIRAAFRAWRKALLWACWLVVYLWLWVVARPCVRVVVRACDALWVRWPWPSTRRWCLRQATEVVGRVAPRLAEHYLSTVARITGRRFVGCGGLGGRAGAGASDDVLPLHSVSLNGCAWMLPYHVGVCSVLVAEGVVDGDTKWLGSSGGALIATAAALGLDLDDQLRACVRIGTHNAAMHALGPCGFMSRFIAPLVWHTLPRNAAERARNKLYISVTECPAADGAVKGNRQLHNLPTRSALYHALMASCYIPLYYETPARPAGLFGPFRFDGGFSDNQPVLRDAHGRCLTTTVSPIPNVADISPTRMAFPNIEHLFPKGPSAAMAVYDSGVAVARRYVKKLRDQQAAINAQRKRRKLRRAGSKS